MQQEFPFDLTTPQVIEDVLVSGDPAEYHIEIGSPAWANGCIFLPSRAVPQSCRVALDVMVLSGSISIGVLPANGRFYFDEVVLEPQSTWQKVSLRIPAAADRGALILRSGEQGLCRLRLRPGTVSSWQAEPDEVEEFRALDALLDASSRLAAARPAVSLLDKQARGAVRSAVVPLLEQLGLVAIEPDNPEFGELFNALEADQLATLAQSIVFPANCNPSRDWQFDAAVCRPEPRWQLRTAVWRAMRQRCPDKVIVLPWLGGTSAAMPLGSDLSLPLFTLGQFEPNIFHVLIPMLRSGDAFVDVGANEGLYTLAAASAVGADGMVVAAEPSARERLRLESNIALNDFSSRVVVVDAALGSEAGWANFTVAEAAHGGQNAFAHQFGNQLTAQETRAAVTLTLDMLSQRLAGRIPDVVKIDVEGAEYDVLRGADWVIEHARPVWFIEIGRTGADGDRRVVSRLAESDYTMFCVDDELGCAVRLSPDADWSRVANMIAVPVEKLAARWPDAPAG